MHSSGDPPADGGKQREGEPDNDTLKYQLLGPSLTKAGQDAVDQQKVRVLHAYVLVFRWDKIMTR